MSRLRASVALNIVLGAALAGLLALRAYNKARVPAVDYFTARHLEARRDLYERLTLPPGAVVLVGDSLTERGEWRELCGRADVYNRGISGDTVAGVRERLDPILRSKPRALGLMIGINDLEAGRAPAEVATGIEGVLTEVRSRAPETRVVVFSVLPMRDVGRGVGVATEKVNELDAAIASACERAGARFVDLRPELTDPDGALAAGFTLDGVHLTGAGYERWAAAVSSSLLLK